MTGGDKEHLLDLLTDTHAVTKAALEGIDPELQVHTDSEMSWRIRDIIGHLTTWDREVAKSLRAFGEGKEYTISAPYDEDEFNQRTVLEQQALSAEQVLVDWEQVHQDLKESVQGLPTDLFPGDLLYPWGDERGSVTQLVEYFCEHDVEHRDEIVKAIQAAGKD